MSRWAKASMLEKRVSGFFAYQFAALSALIFPVETDIAMLEVLTEQFKGTPWAIPPSPSGADDGGSNG